MFSKALLRWCARRRKVGFAVFGKIQFLPIAFHDAVADLRGHLSFVRLLVGVKGFRHADVAAGTMTADKAVEQAAMTLALIAVAVARLLIENFLDAPGYGVGIENSDVAEE